MIKRTSSIVNGDKSIIDIYKRQYVCKMVESIDTKELANLLNESIDIDDLLTDIENGDKFMKVYKQMKMYNDDDLNPVLYQNKKLI